MTIYFGKNVRNRGIVQTINIHTDTRRRVRGKKRKRVKRVPAAFKGAISEPYMEQRRQYPPPYNTYSSAYMSTMIDQKLASISGLRNRHEDEKKLNRSIDTKEIEEGAARRAIALYVRQNLQTPVRGPPPPPPPAPRASIDAASAAHHEEVRLKAQQAAAGRLPQLKEAEPELEPKTPAPRAEAKQPVQDSRAVTKPDSPSQGFASQWDATAAMNEQGRMDEEILQGGPRASSRSRTYKSSDGKGEFLKIGGDDGGQEM